MVKGEQLTTINVGKPTADEIQDTSFVAPDFRDAVTQAYVELGLTEDDATLGEVARAIVELGLK